LKGSFERCSVSLWNWRGLAREMTHLEGRATDAKLLMGLDSAEIRTSNSVQRYAIIAFALATWVRVWAAKRLKSLAHPPTSLANKRRGGGRGDGHSEVVSLRLPTFNDIACA
jgi:hypothetical protein